MKYLKLYKENSQLTLTQEDFEDYFLELKDMKYSISLESGYIIKGKEWDFCNKYEDADASLFPTSSSSENVIYPGYFVEIFDDRDEEEDENEDEDEEEDEDEYEDPFYGNEDEGDRSFTIEDFPEISKHEFDKVESGIEKINKKIKIHQVEIERKRKEQSRMDKVKSIILQALKRIKHIEGEIRVNWYGFDNFIVMVIPKDSKSIKSKKKHSRIDPMESSWGKGPI